MLNVLYVVKLKFREKHRWFNVFYLPSTGKNALNSTLGIYIRNAL